MCKDSGLFATNTRINSLYRNNSLITIPLKEVRIRIFTDRITSMWVYIISFGVYGFLWLEREENIRPIPYLPFWMVCVLFLSVGVLFYIYWYSPGLIFMPLRALIDKRVKRQLIESGHAFQKQMFRLLDLIFYISLSFILLAVIKEKNNTWGIFFRWSVIEKYQDLWFFLGVLISTRIVVFIKNKMFELVAYLFDEVHRYAVFSFNLSMFLKSMGLFLWISVFLYYWDIFQNIYWLQGVLGFSGLMYLSLIVMSFMQIPHKSFIDYLNFILYFCALEIIPGLFLVKLLFLKG